MIFFLFSFFSFFSFFFLGNGIHLGWFHHEQLGCLPPWKRPWKIRVSLFSHLPPTSLLPHNLLPLPHFILLKKKSLLPSHELKWSYLLNVPYVLFPLLFARRLFNQRVASPPPPTKKKQKCFALSCGFFPFFPCYCCHCSCFCSSCCGL